MTGFSTGTPATSGNAGLRGGAEFTAALLQATLSARRIMSMVAVAWDGPQLWTFRCSLGMGEDPERVERMAGALAMAAGAESCRVARIAGGLILEIPKPQGERRTLKAARLEKLEPPAATAVAMGISTGGQVVWLDLADERNAHVVIGGTTGSGKSIALRWLLWRLLTQNAPEDLRLLALDPKRGELEPFGHTPHLLHPVASSTVEIARLLAWSEAEMARRAESGRMRPRVVIVIEEVSRLMKVQRDVETLLGTIAEMGRGLGLHLIVTTQQPGARALGDALVNFPARLLGRVASATLTYGAAGRARSQADQLLGRGDFLLLSAGEGVRLQVPYIDGRQLGLLPRADHVATLEDELPALVEFADRNRDSRGGAGRRELEEDDYGRMQAALREGATAQELADQFGIGYERARRIREGWRRDA